MDLCSEHLRNSVRIAEIEAARLYAGDHPKVESVSFYHLALSDSRLRAS